MGRPRRLFTVAVPAIWATTTAVGIRYPGDEYGLWAVGALPGLWLPVLLGEGNLTRGLWLALPAGIAVTAGLGAVMDRLRAPWPPWYMLWVIAASAICAEIASYPSWARAMSKNGSFQAYVLSSLNIALMLSTITTIAGASAWRAARRLIARLAPEGGPP